MKTSNIFALIGGVAIGATIALLLAPDSGKNTRMKIQKKLKEKGIDLSPEQLDELIEKLRSKITPEEKNRKGNRTAEEMI